MRKSTKIVTKFILLFNFLLLTHTAMANSSISNKLLENLSWKQAESATTTTQLVLIPLGALSKEHGLHLPLNNDYLMANYLRDQILANTEHVLAAPTIGFSYYPSFTEYPGSISLGFETASNLVIDICKSLAKQGFKNFYILNTGYSTIKILKSAQEQLASMGIEMHYSDFEVFFNDPTIQRLLKQQRGSHADELETSMMLYITPQVVHMNLAQKDENIHPDNFTGLSRQPNIPGKLYSPTGAWGDPTLASSHKGKVITEYLVDHLISEVNMLKK